MLVSIFGINCSGKDALAQSLHEHYPHITVLSGSRIMMKAMGYPVEITADYPVSPIYYRRLEEASEVEKIRIYDSDYVDILKRFKQSGYDGVISNHLAVPSRTSKGIAYQYQVRDWFADVYDGYVYVDADAHSIARRRKEDSIRNIRDRGNASIEEINEMLEISSREWESLKSINCGRIPTVGIINKDGMFEEAYRQLDFFIHQFEEGKFRDV